MLPAYFGNMAPVLAGGVLKKLAHPIDFNKTFRGKPIFGTHKTFRGLIMASLFGIIIFALQKLLYQFPFFQKISLIDYSNYTLLVGFLLGFGAIIGDLVKSFFKRQFNHKAGTPWIPFDQTDYVVGALLFVSIIYIPSWQAILVIFIASFLLHIIANHLAYYLKIRKVKW